MLLLFLLNFGDDMKFQKVVHFFDSFFVFVLNRFWLRLPPVFALRGEIDSAYFSTIDHKSADMPKPIPEQKKPQMVLVVDDDADVLAAVCDSLALYDIAYLAARNGQEAISLYNANQHDIILVLLDLKMPEMDGEAVYKALCDINSDITFLISSGYHESDIMSRFIGTGQVGFLPKPFNVTQLIEAIQTYLM